VKETHFSWPWPSRKDKIVICCSALKNGMPSLERTLAHELSHYVADTDDITKNGRNRNRAGNVNDAYSYGVDWDTNGQSTMAEYQADVDRRR